MRIKRKAGDGEPSSQQDSSPVEAVDPAAAKKGKVVAESYRYPVKFFGTAARIRLEGEVAKERQNPEKNLLVQGLEMEYGFVIGYDEGIIMVNIGCGDLVASMNNSGKLYGLSIMRSRPLTSRPWKLIMRA